MTDCISSLYTLLNTSKDDIAGLVSLQLFSPCTVIRFVRVSAKFGTCTVVSVNETRVEVKYAHSPSNLRILFFNKCPIYTHDGASAKLSTNLQETDYSVAGRYD
jgi:hypothetical protein